MLPDLKDCNFFKKSHIDYNGKEEKVMIYRLASSPDYTFLFRCPNCGKNNEFDSALNLKKLREDGKNKEYIIFDCKSCGSGFRIEKLKAAGVRGKKSA
jgi:transcription elongation factor Elf1